MGRGLEVTRGLNLEFRAISIHLFINLQNVGTGRREPKIFIFLDCATYFCRFNLFAIKEVWRISQRSILRRDVEEGKCAVPHSNEGHKERAFPLDELSQIARF